MRFSVIAIVAAIAAVAHAQTDYYPFKPNGACVKSCLLTVGQKMDPQFTDDPTNPYFIASLAYAHERGTPKYIAYMTETGPCIGKCPADEQALYNLDYPAKNDWYVAHKNDAAATASATAPASSTTSAAAGSSTTFGSSQPTSASSSAANAASSSSTTATPTNTNKDNGAGSLAASSLVGAAVLLSAAALF
ncbi:hypothetical protein BGZ79_009503 [Entomortierella chlamydospora]|nr:hypothetical protein BGZ79_009503 [Entomortierella chlamydospora]